jgi:hypothetical protein
MRIPLCLAVLFLALSADLYSQVILTEVMFDPAGNENYDEFLEIFNTSVTDTVDLQGWQIGDQNETDLLVAARTNLLLAPQQYAIILDNGYFINSGFYDELIPPEALVLTIDDAAFGSGGLSNSAAESILLISNSGDTIASYQYSLGNTPGHSDEKILLSADDSAGNWGNSLGLNGTPGSRNSVVPLENDLTVGAINFLPAKPRKGEAVKFFVTVLNLGMHQGDHAALQMMLDTVEIDRKSVSSLVPGDSSFVELTWINPAAGRFQLLFILSGHVDDNSRNDTARVEVTVAWPPEIVRINEIMFAPKAGQAEWIEIYNPTDERISLLGWGVQDESGKPALLRDSISIAARGYFVIAASTSVQDTVDLPDSIFAVAKGFPTLNNGGDLIYFLDFSGAVIDSFQYDGAWGGGIGISLEKVWYERANDETNWLPSLASTGATPGGFNSRSPRDIDMKAVDLFIQPGKPRAGERVRLQVTGYNRGRAVINSPAINFFVDTDGDGSFGKSEKMGEVVSSAILQPEDSLTLSFEIADHPSGRFRVAAVWDNSGDNDRTNDTSFAMLAIGYQSRSVVINEILYDSPDDVEWIELFNRGSQAVDLRGWEFGDAGGRAVMADTISNFILEPGEFFVITGSANHLDARHAVLSNFPNLNNDDDKLVLRDYSGTVQDSVHYFAEWGGGEGISLERINPELGSNDSSNWSGCVSREGGTPGAANSIFTPIVPKETTIDVAPNPFSPDADGHDDVAIIQFRLPVTTAAVHLKIYDMRGRLVRHLLNNAPTGAIHQLIWDGAGDGGETLRMGIYILFLQALNERQGIVQEARTTVVLAKKL